MKHFAKAFLLGVLLFGSFMRVCAQAVDVKAIANQFYPQSLIDEAELVGRPVDRISCPAVYDTYANGSPKTIVVGYSNVLDGDIKMLAVDANGNASQVFEVVGEDGVSCTVQLVDVDGDSKNEILVSYASFRGLHTMDYLLKWDGNKLVDLIAPDKEPRTGHLMLGAFQDISFADLFHDGTLQIIEGGTYPPPMDGSLPERSSDLWKLINGQYSFVEDVLDAGEYDRDAGTPTPETTHFLMTADLQGRSFVLHLSNGKTGGKNRASSAHVVLNGTDVVTPQMLNQNVEFLDVPVGYLPLKSTLTVTLAGAPGSVVYMTIAPVAEPGAAQSKKSLPTTAVK